MSVLPMSFYYYIIFYIHDCKTFCGCIMLWACHHHCCRYNGFHAITFVHSNQANPSEI
jgi:hypothetical protein